MKTEELLEGELSDLAEVLLLVKHGDISKQQAEALAATLRKFEFFTKGKRHILRLRWVENRTTGTLQIVNADLPGSWRSGVAAVSRYTIITELMKNGFSVARFAANAINRIPSNTGGSNGPHIFFWGPKTPPPKKENFEKVWGTKEALDKLHALVKPRVSEGAGDLKELSSILELRSTPSRITREQATAAYEWLKAEGYRYETRDNEGVKHFRIVNASFRNVDYRSKLARDERLAAERALRDFGFKVGRLSSQVIQNKDLREFDWFDAGTPRYVYFW